MERKVEPEGHFDEILKLYEVESNLIQKKTSQILTIRSLAATLLVAVSSVIGVFGFEKSTIIGLYLLALLFIPFYLLESTYDSHLIPIHNRDLLLKSEIAKKFSQDSSRSELASSYKVDVQGVFDLDKHGALRYALTRRMRLVYYFSIVLVYLILVSLLGNII